ncbi:MAG TPA: polyprenol monophosphomannose synthase, partial [Tepidisphaeraceae bacterium]
VCERLSDQYPLRLIIRRQPRDGLAGAVLLGMSHAGGEILVVMDADLQHPPRRLPDLLAPLDGGEADFTLGSRYVPGGSTGEQWGLTRKINSRVATLLARPFAGRVLDPMSGFFALKRSTFEQAKPSLNPLGYKIGLELMCKCDVRNVVEVPIHFAERARGKSKMSLREQVRYLKHLGRLYEHRFPRMSRSIKLLGALAGAWVIGIAASRLVPPQRVSGLAK